MRDKSMGAESVPLKKRKAPVFTEARRRPSIPSPLESIIPLENLLLIAFLGFPSPRDPAAVGSNEIRENSQGVSFSFYFDSLNPSQNPLRPEPARRVASLPKRAAPSAPCRSVAWHQAIAPCKGSLDPARYHGQAVPCHAHVQRRARRPEYPDSDLPAPQY